MPRLEHHKLERHTTERGSIHVIEVPPKFWRPKQVNKYVPLEYADDIKEGVFDFLHYGKTVFRPNIQWKDRVCDDIILYDKSAHEEEITLDLKDEMEALHFRMPSLSGQDLRSARYKP